jgi:hypothetical protein
MLPNFPPFVFGEKSMLSVQFVPGATLFPQVEAMPNSPFTTIEEMLSVASPVLVRVTVCGLLFVPVFCP